ncbi:MAG: glutaredoxin family protein [Gammaproteobacteria bacterium]|nr:glutaredoxin family protein [Gammaproteobacteria bacterium]
MRQLPACFVAITIALSVTTTPTSARTIVECVMPDGTSTFADRCPAGARKKGERVYRNTGEAKQPVYGTARPVVTFFTVAGCDACDLVRNALLARAVPFDEKDVADSADNQAALRTATGGLSVPTVLIGETPVSGYNRTALDNALNAAGFEAPASTN